MIGFGSFIEHELLLHELFFVLQKIEKSDMKKSEKNG
jgi:hypothetical protein